MRNWIWRWGPAFLTMIIIFIASSTPGSNLPTFGVWDLFGKKGGHMLGYALLAIAYFHALSSGRSIARFPFLPAFLLACLYAASDEFHQRFTPGRTPSIVDILIDAIGAALGLLFVWSWVRHRRAAAFRSSPGAKS